MKIEPDKIVAWIRKQVATAGAKGCVFGLSGGVDSAVVGALCKKACPENVLGLLMPCFSREEDLKHALQVAEEFSILTKQVDLDAALAALYQAFEGKLYDGRPGELAVANIKPRLRMIALYYFANQHNYLVVGTGNKSEAVMGYFTKYGDGGVDILPLGGLLKFQVKKLAKELGIPQEIINKTPSAGLWPGQTDEGEMGMTYTELDKIILGMAKNDLSGLDAKLIRKVKQNLTASGHKRSPPPVFNMS